MSVKSKTIRFDTIVSEGLPKKKAMFEVLMKKAIPASDFNQHGMGTKTILKQLGRILDFKGIFAFIENNEVVFVDDSSFVTKRLIRHFKGSNPYQQKLAHNIQSIEGRKKDNYELEDAIQSMSKMKVVLMDIPDELERQLTKLYLQSRYKCIYNIEA